jgi:hypothetical protein
MYPGVLQLPDKNTVGRSTYAVGGIHADVGIKDHACLQIKGEAIGMVNLFIPYFWPAVPDDLDAKTHRHRIGAILVQLVVTKKHGSAALQESLHLFGVAVEIDACSVYCL